MASTQHFITLIKRNTGLYFDCTAGAGSHEDDHHEVHDHRRKRRSADDHHEEDDHDEEHGHDKSNLPGCYSAERILNIFDLPKKGIEQRQFYR